MIRGKDNFVSDGAAEAAAGDGFGGSDGLVCKGRHVEFGERLRMYLFRLGFNIWRSEDARHRE